MTNRELGGHLYVSENTIKTQLRHLYAKLNVRNRAQAASLAGSRHPRRPSPTVRARRLICSNTSPSSHAPGCIKPAQKPSSALGEGHQDLVQ
jgi:hypothetical protein